MTSTHIVFLSIVISILISHWHDYQVQADDYQLDPNGYILFCPCMGRFGNQADHYLGAVSFAKGLDRTLVLPPWVEYPVGSRKSKQVPFKTYFQVEDVAKYHRVIPMEDFMEQLAPSIWPSGKRTVYCYSSRNRDDSGKPDCKAKDGNPFGPFWDTFDIEFYKSEFYGPLFYDTNHKHTVDEWNGRYPASEHYVMAFTGAPAAFPIRQEDVHIQQYFVWSNFIMDKARTFISTNMGDGPFLGLHMRNGRDWENACEHVSGNSERNMFGSAQCLGFRQEHGHLTKDLCFPPENTVLKQIKKAAKKIKAKAIFVATDNDPMRSKIKAQFQKSQIPVVTYDSADPHVDLAILGLADHYIGNCVSTFSAFATRARRVHGKSCEFWAFLSQAHDEL